jgi:hypothetical protein
MAITRSRPTFQQNAISASLLLVVPAGILALWLQDRWAAFKARFWAQRLQALPAPTARTVRSAARRDLSKDKERLPNRIQRAFRFAIARSLDCTRHIPGRAMTSGQNPASSHIRMMELRIEQQVESIERLKQSGQDTADAERRLSLLQRALGEMRVQLGQLSPTELDNKRPDTTRSTLIRQIS